MAGTYIGTPHGGNDFTGESGFDVQRKMKTAAAVNVARASNGGRNKVVSADGKRVLFDPNKHVLTKSGKVIDKPKADEPKTDKARGKAVVSTSGPGVPGVGKAPSSGAGVPVTGSPAVPGPGGLGVETTFQGNSGVLIPTAGPGVPSVGGAGVGPAAGVGTVGWSGRSGDLNGGDPWFEIGKTTTTLPDGGNQRTPYKQFGITIQPSDWFSDAKFYEDRAGDDGPGSWLNQVGTSLADYYNTLDLALGRPRAALAPNRQTRDGAGGSAW